MEISNRAKQNLALLSVVAAAGSTALAVGGLVSRNNQDKHKEISPATAVATSSEYPLDVIAQSTYKAMAEVEARRLNKGIARPVKTDTNLFPAGVIGEPGSSEDERLVNGVLPPAETGVDHGVTGPAVPAIGSEVPAGPINEGTTPTGEVPVLSRPLAVPQGLSSVQDR